MKNRLNLDFSLSTNKERAEFISKYIPTLQSPTESELSTMADYILWGVDPVTLKNPTQDKSIELNSKWSPKEIDSLDELKESPTFNEAQISTLPLKTKKEVFSREEARAHATPFILEKLEILWREIDSLELLLNFYELANGRRTEIRPSLLSRFSPEEIAQIQSNAALTQYAYLKKRHLLVEKRREQYTFKDSYSSLITRSTPLIYSEPEPLIIAALPCGLKTQSQLAASIFPLNRLPTPSDFTSIPPSLLNSFLSQPSTSFIINFQNPDHLYSIFQDYIESYESLEAAPSDSYIPSILNTLHYYISIARLDPMHHDILRMKIQKITNYDIASYINKTYNKTYNSNYISTIFTKKILTSIADAALIHSQTIQNIYKPSSFKTCKGCGRTLLINNHNFIKKSNSKDGFSSKCKECEKLRRLKYGTKNQ